MVYKWYGCRGEDKYSSSSTLLERWAKSCGPWGKFYVLAKGEEYPVKELIVDVGKELSRQYHLHRSEVWQVIEGTGKVSLDELNKLNVALRR